MTFQSTLSITHIGTATAIIDINGIKLLTDPFFSPAGTKWDIGGDTILEVSDTPALSLDELPPIDAVLLSHEDHPDNLDDLGRRILDGRHVFTTCDGSKNLAPRPGVRGMKPWETASVSLGGQTFEITATPCQHVPGGECTGFILTTKEFGVHSDGRPNAIYFTGDTVYIDDFQKIPEKFYIMVAMMNLGSAFAPLPTGPLQITMDGQQGAKLLKTLEADYLVPMHFESWGHFTEFGKDLVKAFDEAGISDKVRWLTPGKPVKIL